MIYLSFDIEEFDMPLEYGYDLTFCKQLNISRNGTIKILDILKRNEIKASFFSTAQFALNNSDLIKTIVEDGHELGSHTYYHSAFKEEHLLESRLCLEKLVNRPIQGLRMPRMQQIDAELIKKAGYVYNSSLNPTYLPGRYQHLDKPRRIFRKSGIWEIPASVSPLVRFPLFWLSFHHLPLKLYQFISLWTLRKDSYLNLYFHPWELEDLNEENGYGIPKFLRKNSGDLMVQRLDILIQFFKKKGIPFGTLNQLVNINSRII